MRRKITLGLTLWLLAITALHLILNVNWAIAINQWLPLDKRKLNVAYIPVT